jgi:hypothetical protein
MSKVSEIREICGDYAIDIEYSKDYTFVMFFNSRRNAETVKRCIEVDDSVPNVATAVDFVEVVRCKDCKHLEIINGKEIYAKCRMTDLEFKPFDIDTRKHYCSWGERREDDAKN